MRISDWSSDVCSSDLEGIDQPGHEDLRPEPVRALPGRRDLLRGRAALRRLGQRGAPAHQARPGRRRTHPVAGAGRGRGGRGELRRPPGAGWLETLCYDRMTGKGAEAPFSFSLLYTIHRKITHWISNDRRLTWPTPSPNFTTPKKSTRLNSSHKCASS